ncbi:MAG: 3-isopropylmalate dehydratase [Deltaproteobacteria bacterium]|nr:3-isopropylmalate dehydratase [Deltaproteobacteria bacterium]
MLTIKGSVWKFGDGIDTDIIIPARYLIQPMEDMKWKAMEPIRPEFASLVKEGDVIVGGLNFGCGSSREQAPAVLAALGIRAIVAVSFARIFFRNAVNLGIPVIECRDVYEQANEGDTVEMHPSSGKIRLEEKGMEFTGSRLPDFLLAIIERGGLIPRVAKDGGK